MKNTQKNTQLVIQKQAEMKKNHKYYKDNRLLVLYLALVGGVSSTISFIKTSLKMENDEWIEYIEALNSLDLITSKDITLIEKINNKAEVKNKIGDAEIVFEHLNTILGKKRRMNEKRKTRILSLFSKGYTTDDLFKMHLYFAQAWNNPTMSKYLTPETLYNTKVESRIEAAKEYFEEIEQYKKDIENIFTKFPDIAIKEIYPEQEINTPTFDFKNMYKDIPLSLQESIVFWRRKGWSIEAMIQTIKITIENWSKKPELIPHISIKKILDDKFPTRAIAVEKILDKKNKNSVNKVSDWVSKNTKEENTDIEDTEIIKGV